jgi:CRP-like cAMP-binding protein
MAQVFEFGESAPQEVAKVLVQKLERYQAFDDEDRAILVRLPGAVRRYAARCEIAADDVPPRGTNLVLSGIANRLKVLPDGRRQILSFFLPGDFCDLHVLQLTAMDHTIATVTPALVALLPEEPLNNVMQARPRIARAFWIAALAQEAVSREWLVSAGRRSALERAAHLFCEIYTRLAAVGRAAGGQCDWPFSQADLADALGLSTVHVNRTLQDLRSRNLIKLRGRALQLPDFERLADVALFDSRYLHLDRADG